MILDRADVNSLNTRFQLDFKRAADCIRIDSVGRIEQRVTAAARNLERFGARNLVIKMFSLLDRDRAFEARGFLRCEVMEVIALREDEPVCEALAERGFKKRFVLSDRWVPFYPADQHAPILGHIGETEHLPFRKRRAGGKHCCKEDAVRCTENLGQ
jgi:hypothetical protein